MRALIIIAAMVLVALVVVEARGRGGPGRRPGPGRGGGGGRRPGVGGRPGGGGRRPGPPHPKPPKLFENAKWKRQIPFNDTTNVEAKECAKFNEEDEVIFFMSSDKRRLRKTEFSTANTMMDFNVSKMAIRTYTSAGLVCFITDTMDTFNNTVDEIRAKNDSSTSVPLGADYPHSASVYSGDLDTVSERLNNFCCPRGLRNYITIYELTASTGNVANTQIGNIALPCLEGLMSCDDGTCVSGSLCDGITQCADLSDENNCDSTSTDATTTTNAATSDTATTTTEATTTDAATATTAGATTTGDATSTVQPEEEVIKLTNVFGYFTITIQG